MRIVVTGATGFLAGELIKLLLNHGHEVYAVCRNREKAESLFPDVNNITFIESVMSDYGLLDTKIKHADIFVSLAWDTLTPDQRDSVYLQKDNIKNTISAMHAAIRMGCEVFVESGTQAEYGPVNDIITEKTTCNPINEYGKAKLALKDICTQIALESGIKYIHTRIFSVFGLRDHPYTLINTCLNKFRKNEPVDLSPCTQTWNFLYVKDAVKQIYLLCLYALQSSEYVAEVYNLASEDTGELKKYIEEMKATMKSSSQLNFGAVQLKNLVSLTPSVEKLKSAIGFISDYSFAEAIIEMNKNYELWQR